jgi:hypothetical protein
LSGGVGGLMLLDSEDLGILSNAEHLTLDVGGLTELDCLLFVVVVLAAFLSSLASFAIPWVSVLTAGRIRLVMTATFALIMLLAAFAIAVLAVAVHTRRGLWAAAAAAPAMFWPALVLSLGVHCLLVDCD